MGRIEKMEDEEDNMKLEFVDATIGMNIPKNFIPSIEKGFYEACERGFITGHKICGMKFILEDGAAHAVDSSDLSFRLCAMAAVKIALEQANPMVLEPLMSVEIVAPNETQGIVMGGLNKRRGLVTGTEASEEYFTVYGEVPLNEMFGYSNELRSLTQGKGEFSMEFKRYAPAFPQLQAELIEQYRGGNSTSSTIQKKQGKGRK